MPDTAARFPNAVERAATLQAIRDEHSWSIESADRMCMDQFEREFWRGVCSSCGATARWRFYRSQAMDDYYSHVVDVMQEARNV